MPLIKKHLISSLGLALAALLMLTGCNGGFGASANESLVTQDVADSEATLAKLQNAKQIHAKKAVLSFGDQWTIEADGEELGEIRGQVIPLLGDTYSFFSTKGNLVGSEGEDFKLVLRGAKLYDHSNVLRGSIRENLSLLFADYEVKDLKDKTLAKAKQELSFGMKFEVKDPEGVPIYKISKAVFSFGADVTIDRVVEESPIEAIDALWLALMASEIDEAGSSKNSKSWTMIVRSVPVGL